MNTLKNILRSNNLLLVAAISLAALLCVTAVLINGPLEKFRIDKAVELDTNKLASALNEIIGRSVERIVSISAFYAASQEVERDEFKAFVTPYLLEDPSVLAYEWAPRISGSDRGSFEAGGKQAGIKDFKITEWSADGTLVEAPLRKEHYPVYFVEPMAGNEKAFGFDLASSRLRWEVMHEAMRSGMPLATPALRLVHGSTEETGFLILAPIYHNGSRTDTLESRLQNLQGFALGIFTVQSLLENFMQQVGSGGLEISLSESADGKENVIYSSFSQEPRPRDFRYAAPVKLAQRQWIMKCRPTEAYINSFQTDWQEHWGWTGFITGTIFLILLLGWILYRESRPWAHGRSDFKSHAQSSSFLNSFAWMLDPPIRFMNRLRYGQKFMLISFLFILPLLLTGMILVLELRGRIDFSQKEIYGNEYLRPLKKILDQTSRARFFAFRYSLGDIRARPELIHMLSGSQQGLEELARSDRKWGGLLKTEARYANLLENFRFLKKSTQHETPQHYIDLSEKFFVEIRAFISYVGDISNLILDPDLDTYYLMDAVLLKFPELRERLRDIRILAYQAIQARDLPVDSKAEFIRLRGVINFNTNELAKGFETALKNNPAGNLKISLQKPLSDFQSAMNALLNQSEHNLAHVPITQLDLTAYDNMVLKCLDTTEALWEQCFTDLDILLQRRINGFLQRRDWTLFFSVLIVFIALYMWLAFYASFMRTVSSLESASERMVSGGEIKETQLETKDELSRVVRSFNNIALRLRQERDQAKEGEDRFRIIAENMSNLIYEWNMLTNSLTWFGKIDEYLGYGPGEFPRTFKAWEMTIHPDDRPRVLNAINRHIKTREPFFEEYRVIKANGEIAIWIDGGTVLQNHGKAPVLWVGAITDVTERKRLEGQLLQSQKMDAVGKLAGGVAHDLNNLLTVINGYSDMILGSLTPNNPMHADLEEIFKAGKRAQDLTDQLLSFSRRQVVKPVLVNLNTLLLNLENMIKRLLGEPIEIVLMTEDSLRMTRVDPGQMEQVIINLVVNARDAIPGTGKIIVQSSNVVLGTEDAKNNPGLKPGPYVRLSVADTGLGMSEEVKRHLFEPFFTTKPKGKGTGLGLTTCYGIIKQMGGHLAFHSKAGKGTTVEIFLPVAEETSDTGEKEKEKEKEKETLPQRSENILLVEDESMVRQLCAQVLSKQGYNLFIAQDGVEALHLFEELTHKHTKVDLLLTDVIMPQMGGKETADRIKKIQPNLKVLFMSGYTGDALDAAGVPDSAIELIKKPFSPLSLLKMVDQVLGNGKENW